MSVRSIDSAKRKVWLVAEMFKDQAADTYFLNEIVSVWAVEPAAKVEAERLALEGGTYSVFEHEVRHGVMLM